MTLTLTLTLGNRYRTREGGVVQITRIIEDHPTYAALGDNSILYQSDGQAGPSRSFQMPYDIPDLTPLPPPPSCSNPKCGSSELRCDAYAAFNPLTYEWELHSTYDHIICDDCGATQ